MVSVNRAKRGEAIAHNSEESYKNVVDNVDKVFVLIATTDPACASSTIALLEGILLCLPIRKSTHTRPNVVMRKA